MESKSDFDFTTNEQKKKASDEKIFVLSISGEKRKSIDDAGREKREKRKHKAGNEFVKI